MVEEGWSLSDVMAFVKEYKLNILVVDKEGTTIPEAKRTDFMSNTVIEQSRPKGDAIIEGITLKVKVNGTYEAPKPVEENKENNQTE